MRAGALASPRLSILESRWESESALESLPTSYELQLKASYAALELARAEVTEAKKASQPSWKKLGSKLIPTLNSWRIWRRFTRPPTPGDRVARFRPPADRKSLR